ncbi:hypothetical protein KNP414_06659 [Paenibacillus mucilaginosus KNP414]|uniref:Uncharacterized protein n=1 Tax=Paenibacillus mucilaginosus (strain KNP414) TaxID=1036673 RepID=F8F9Y0_PAEMK|nr:hypothetical protein KNP414_06659 [Paenibacillus mucilaginosus KNP414]
MIFTSSIIVWASRSPAGYDFDKEGVNFSSLVKAISGRSG